MIFSYFVDASLRRLKPTQNVDDAREIAGAMAGVARMGIEPRRLAAGIGKARREDVEIPPPAREAVDAHEPLPPPAGPSR